MRIQKLLSTTAMMVVLATSGMAYAHEASKSHESGYMDETLSKMSSSGAAQLRTAMKDHHDKNKDDHGQIKKLYEEMHAIMIAPTFDKKAYLSKEAEIEKLHEKKHEEISQSYADVISKLSVSDRTVLADSMKEHAHHRHHHSDSSSHTDSHSDKGALYHDDEEKPSDNSSEGSDKSSDK